MEEKQFNDVLNTLSARWLIPVLEKGLEIEQLYLSADDTAETKSRIADTQVLLCFLRVKLLKEAGYL